MTKSMERELMAEKGEQPKVEELSKLLEQNTLRLREIERRLGTLQNDLSRAPAPVWGPAFLGNYDPFAASTSSASMLGPATVGGFVPPTAVWPFMTATPPSGGGMSTPLSLPPTMGGPSSGGPSPVPTVWMDKNSSQWSPLSPWQGMSSRDFKSIPPVVRIPQANVVDLGTHYLVQVEMAGVKKEDLDITVTERSINITGQARCDPANGTVLQGECLPTEYRRTIHLPNLVHSHSDDGKATLKDGLLTLKISKREPGEGPRRIDVAYG